MGEVSMSLGKLRSYIEESPGYVLQEEEDGEVQLVFQPHTEEAMSHMYGQSVIRLRGRVKGDQVTFYSMELEDDRGTNKLDPESLQGWIWEVEAAGE